MNSKANRRVLVIALALSSILAIGLAISPISAMSPMGTWDGNCPMLHVLDTQGLSSVGKCSEVNVQLGLCRVCSVFDMGNARAKGNCVTTPLGAGD